MRLVLIGGLFAIICATLSGESNQKPDVTLVFPATSAVIFRLADVRSLK